MKSVKKSILLVICALALVTASVFGTLAYLTDTAEVVNTFTVGNVDITLDETEVRPDGTPVDEDDDGTPDRTEEGNEYHLIPGKEYTKDPTITVKAGSEDSYVRMIMTINNASAVQAIIDNGGDEVEDYADLLAYIANNDGVDTLTPGFNPEWEYVNYTYDETANTIAFEFRYKDTVDGYDEDGTKADIVLPPLFDKLVVPGTATAEQIAALYGDKEDADGDFVMTLVGEAIQAAGFETADAAWAAFEAQVKTTTTTPAPEATSTVSETLSPSPTNSPNT